MLPTTPAGASDAEFLLAAAKNACGHELLQPRLDFLDRYATALALPECAAAESAPQAIRAAVEAIWCLPFLDAGSNENAALFRRSTSAAKKLLAHAPADCPAMRLLAALAYRVPHAFPEGFASVRGEVSSVDCSAPQPIELWPMTHVPKSFSDWLRDRTSRQGSIDLVAYTLAAKLTGQLGRVDRRQLDAEE